MTTASSSEPTPQKPLRLWPGITIAVLLVLVRVGVPMILPDIAMFGVLGGLAAGLMIAVWWLFFSRAPWSERLGVLVLMSVAAFATRYVVHDSLNSGMIGGILLVFVAIPGLAVALVAGLVASRGLATGRRRAVLLASILIACGTFTLLRTDGIIGGGAAQLRWRWTPTGEQRLLAGTGDSLSSAPATAMNSDVPVATREWPGFRGPGRDGIIRHVRIETDWAKSPPVVLWRRPIGPGWSSIAVVGEFLYTQEQRGDDEVVACYQVATGKPVWMHRDAARFYEPAGGAGPRGTPTVHNGRVYTMGATGIVNALDASHGTVVWSRNAQADTGAPPPGWGFAASPLVVDDLVIVAASGRLVGYETATGAPRWKHTTGGGGYSSPQLITIDGVPQILLLSGGGATSVSPADGTRLWQVAGIEGVSIVQPAFASAGDVLVAAGDMVAGVGIRRVAVSRGSSGWTVDERWTSRGLKPFFNDFVVHEGHAYGFDRTILASIDLSDGSRKWKGGRYGAGQLVLLPEQDLLLVLSEEGELALVNATPDRFTELARFKAIEGKTWNHPVVVGDILLVRNGEEMAAFQLPLTGR
jgi:hypothetical protein